MKYTEISLKYTREDIQKIYDEVERRIDFCLKNGLIHTGTILSYRENLLQGVYSVLMVHSDNWPYVSQMCEEEEKQRGWYE